MEITPEELLSSSFVDDRWLGQAWTVRWDTWGGDVRTLLPPRVTFHTSGTTGTAAVWSRPAESLLTEAGLLASLAGDPAAMLSFAPPRHLFGALSSVLVPAVLKIPVFYVPQFTDPLPHLPDVHWLVGAIPWSYSILRRARWGADAAKLTVLHSTAMLPEAARQFADEHGRTRLVEIFGSTETGGVATREGDQPWRLFDDVEFTAEPGDEDVSLSVRGPRLAVRPDGTQLSTWDMDDQVRIIDERRFVFQGRRASLVNVNGRRLSLDELDAEFRRHVTCADLACVPVADELRGEHFDLHVVASDDAPPVDLDALAGHVGIRPRALRYVAEIARTETGKVRRIVEREKVHG